MAVEGATFAQDDATTREEFETYWLGRGGAQFVADLDGAVAGGYTLRPNHPGRGSHVATASYIVAEAARGRKLGRLLGGHSIEEARRMGFHAIQFNLVVSTNEAAVRLWKSLGFAVVGVLPEAFEARGQGRVDAFVMYLRL